MVISDEAIDTQWLLQNGYLVFFMQLGFALLEAGAVRPKNVNNILFKNLVDCCLGCLCWFLFGYAFTGLSQSDGNVFIGTKPLALASGSTAENEKYATFFFQFAFAATAATIVSGAMAERTRVTGYFLYTAFITIFIYPVIVHWVWHGSGWLNAWNANTQYKMIDFAGSGVVHMVGGFAALVGAAILGPRRKRFKEGRKCCACTWSGSSVQGQTPYPPHHVPFMVAGTFILWYGWYGFNGGSTLMMSGGLHVTAARVAVTTTLAAVTGAMTTTFYSKIFLGYYSVALMCNGFLAGLVSITAPCPVVAPHWAVVIGFLGAIVYVLASKLLVCVGIDDPLDAFPVHGACGVWGCLAAGIFQGTSEMTSAGYTDNVSLPAGKQFGIQLLGVVAIAAWTSGMSLIMFLSIHLTVGLRVDAEQEKRGLDKTEHGMWSAYNQKTLDSGSAPASPRQGPKSEEQQMIALELNREREAVGVS